jgi:DNA processing protein
MEGNGLGMSQMEWDERDWLYTLVLTSGLGRRTLRSIYEEWGSFRVVAEQLPDLAARFAWPEHVTNLLAARLSELNMRREKEERLKAGVEFVCLFDEEYPAALREIPDAPLLLFYRGELGLLKRPAIGVVGSRKPTPYGRAACAHLVKQLSEAGFVIVSGLAYGIDAEAHRSCLRAGGRTVGVLGCGIDQIYPPSNRKLFEEIGNSGLLLSEHPPGAPPLPGLFPERNRIISGLSLGVLVVEAAARSGSLITADCALEQGREVFAVPGPIFSEVSVGPHNLIKQGAKLVTNSSDMIEEFAHLLPAGSSVAPPSPNTPCDPEEQTLFALISHEPIHWDELAAALSPDLFRRLDQHLIRLEGQGLIMSMPGGYYVRR